METVFELEQSFVHPLYEVGHSANNDIALIKLKGSITYSREVAPLCLPEKDVSPGTICVTVGWGNTKGEHERKGVNTVKCSITRPTPDTTLFKPHTAIFR